MKDGIRNEKRYRLKYQSCNGNVAFTYPDEAGNNVSKTFGEVYYDMNILENWISSDA